MRTRSRFLALFTAVGATGCTAGSGPADSDTDADTDLTCAFERPVRGAAGALQAGVATARIPAPVGIGTAGFGPSGGSGSKTPFSQIYPGTKRVHGHPEVKAVYLSRGEGHEVVFVRIDAVGVFSQLRNEIVERASARVGTPLDHALLFGASHTHSGPGRVVNTGTTDTSFFDLIADKFDPEFYDRFVEAVVDVIVAAHADLAPAELGTAEAYCADGHSDRRCEDGTDSANGTLPLVAVRRGGQVDAVVFSYAVHGTLLGLSDLHLSQDVSGAIEEAIEDRFDHPVEALFFNSWGADMSPGSPVDPPNDPAAADLGGDYRRMREIGWTVANAVDDVSDAWTWTDSPELALETHRIRIDRDVIGYDEETFEAYPFGAVYCGVGAESDCPATERAEDLDDKCIPFNEAFPAPMQTSTTFGRVGPFTVVTFPGEPGTLLAEALIGRIREAHPEVEDVMFLGYTQDYIGYSILEDDWWLGGYEASGALWGPKQGQYLSDRIVTLFGAYATGACPDVVVDPLVPFPYTIDAPYAPATPVDPGTSVEGPADTVAHDGVITWTFRGVDPWLGAPTVTLRDGSDAPVVRPNGVPVDSHDYNVDVELTVTPDWPEAASARTFAWRVRMPVRQPVGGVALAAGTYTLSAEIPGQAAPLVSSAFTVEAAPADLTP